MDIFNELPLEKRNYMCRLFQNCSEKVKYYMSLIEVEEDTALIEAGSDCEYIYIILSGYVTGIDWPVNEKAYCFKKFGPGDFFGEIECFADLMYYRISVVTITKCRVLTIPVSVYIEWLQTDLEALYSRTKVNISRLIKQTTDARRYMLLDSKERLILFFVRRYEQYQTNKKILTFNQTRVKMSEEVGLSVKTLNRMIKTLEEAGFIQTKKGKVVVTEQDYQRMKEYIDQYIYGEI